MDPSQEQQSTNAPATVVAQAATAATATAAAPPRTKVKQKAPMHSKGRKGIIEIPEAAFKARVQREAAAEVRRQTGVTIEEAVRLIKAGGTQVTGGGQAAITGTANAALEQLRSENARLRKSQERMTRESAQTVKKLEKRVRSANDSRIEAELRAEARIAGITDPEYAVSLFARAAGADAAVTPESFFAGLKTTHPVLFASATPAAPAPRVTVAPTTAPAESPAAGEVRPTPTPAGAPPSEINAEEMSSQEFAAHQRRYGYVPGQA